MTAWPDTWGTLHDDRWRWVDERIDDFRLSCDPALALDRHFDSSGRTFNAVLFGRTQTGKTTLLLRLLGVRDEEFARVAEVLRAGRKAGDSSTAVPTRYSWSCDQDLWELRTVDGAVELLSAAQVSARIARFRDPSGAPVDLGGCLEIGIPTSLRDEAQVGGQYARVIDLPGADAQDPAEQELAKRLIEAHVPAAHLVVMVLWANQIASAFASGLAADVPDLRIWSEIPERFRIVVTGTYSQESVREAMACGDLTDLRSIREHLWHQLRTGDLGHTIDHDQQERIMNSLFPVEYGDSWCSLQSKFPEVHELASGLVEAELQRLRDSLEGTAAEDSWRIGFVKAAKTIKQATQREITRREEAIDRLRGEVDRAQSERQQWDNRVAGARQQMEESKTLEACLDRSGSPLFEGLVLPGADETGKEMRDRGRKYEDALSKAATSAWDKWAGSDPVRKVSAASGVTPSRPDLRGVFTEEWACVRECGERCSSKWKVWAPDPEICDDRQRQAAPLAQMELGSRLQFAATAWRAEATRSLEAKGLAMKPSQLALSTSEHHLHEARQRVADLQADLQERKGELAAYSASMNDALKRAERLEDDLRQSLRQELGRLEELGSRTDDSDEQLLIGLAEAMTLTNFERLNLRRPTTSSGGESQ